MWGRKLTFPGSRKLALGRKTAQNPYEIGLSGAPAARPAA